MLTPKHVRAMLAEHAALGSQLLAQHAEFLALDFQHLSQAEQQARTVDILHRETDILERAASLRRAIQRIFEEQNRQPVVPPAVPPAQTP